MALENQLTIYTDFDKTMIKENSPMYFFPNLLRRVIPSRRVAIRAFQAFLRGGIGGEVFLEAISEADAHTKGIIANKVVKMLSFNKKWLYELRNLVLKNPRMKNIKLVIITRNIRIIPELFIELYHDEITNWSQGRFRHDFVIVANESVGSSSVRRQYVPNLTLPIIINQSREKGKFIKSKNAFFFGDQEEYNELVRHTNLRDLHFIIV
ncbi:MAG: haloacid dehalogenase-like hydrolase [archaeon]